MSRKLSKHHGLGNDFLVWFTDQLPGDAEGARLARALCERHRGVGADGLLVGVLSAGGAEAPHRHPDAGQVHGPVDPATADAVMVLYNADGSRAEMSGNGIRCFAQALTRRLGLTEGTVHIATDAGPRRVTVRPSDGGHPEEIEAVVDMGIAHPGPAPRPAAAPTVAVQKEATVDLGNPHLVLLVDDPDAVDVGAAGPAFEAAFDGGINVHFVAPAAEPGALQMRTWERGAGVTEACGTGACAAAHAAAQWGLVEAAATVHMPGGDVEVGLWPTGEVTLSGPAVWIADVEVAS